MNIKKYDDLKMLKENAVKEGERWEFKSDWPKNEKLRNTICAFANTNGGTIIIGLNYDDDNHVIVGFPGIEGKASDAEKPISVSLDISPRVVPTIELLEVHDNKRIIVIQVDQSLIPPHMSSDGKYYIRVGSQNTHLPEPLVEKLYQARWMERENVETYIKSIGYGIDYTLEPHQTIISIIMAPISLDEERIPLQKGTLDTLNTFNLHSLNRGQFRSTHFGFNLPTPNNSGRHEAALMENVPSRLLEVHKNGLFLFSYLLVGDDLNWDHTETFFKNSICFFNELISNYNYPALALYCLSLKNFRNKSFILSDNQILMSQSTEFQRMPSIGEISFCNEFSIPTPDDEINNIISYFKNCILSTYGLDDFLA